MGNIIAFEDAISRKSAKAMNNAGRRNDAATGANRGNVSAIMRYYTGMPEYGSDEDMNILEAIAEKDMEDLTEAEMDYLIAHSEETIRRYNEIGRSV